jgi:hypothetical protein
MSPETKRSELPDEAPNRLERYKDYPDLTYWFGLTPEELYVLPRWMRRVYVEALPRLKAEVTVDRINAAMFPKLKKSDRSRTANKLNRVLNPVEPVKPQGRRDLRQKIAAAGIGMKIVKKRKGAEK